MPVPSWADAAYLSAPPFAAAALLAHPAVHGRTTGKARAVLDGSVIATALFFVAWTECAGDYASDGVRSTPRLASKRCRQWSEQK